MLRASDSLGCAHLQTFLLNAIRLGGLLLPLALPVVSITALRLQLHLQLLYLQASRDQVVERLGKPTGRVGLVCCASTLM